VIRDRAEIGVFGGSGLDRLLDDMTFASNIAVVRDLILRLIPVIPIQRDCACRRP
jgi:hypothetical protein